MVIPKSPHVDRLDVSTLRGPLLDDYYGSAIQRQDVMKVAEEIKRRHLAKLPTETGNLKSTARVTARRSREHRDGRYEAEYSIGGPRADYIVPLEDKHHYLDEVLREMGFYTGDIVNGPTGTIPAAERRPIYSMTDSEIRQRNLEGALANAAANPVSAEEPPQQMRAARSELDVEIGMAADMVINARPGSAAAEAKFRALDSLHRQHMFEYQGQRSGVIENAMGIHNLKRQQRGLDPLPKTPDPPAGFGESD